VDRKLSLCVRARIRAAVYVDERTDIFKNDYIVGCGIL
jgi:hypothetical protein